MINKTIRVLALALMGACLCIMSVQAQTVAPSTFKHITIDGSFNDWAGVPIAYTAPIEGTNTIEYENIYLANDQSNLYIRCTLYVPRPSAFANTFDNIFIDTDDNPLTGYSVAGIGSEMLIQWGGGYQETNAGFNIGAIDGLGWNVAGSPDSTDFEMSISLGATDATGGGLVFATNTIALVMEGDTSGYINGEFAPLTGGLVYTFATNPPALTGNVSLIALTNSWEVNASGTDLSTNWLAQDYNDSGAGWTTGEGLLGYTPFAADYPPILTALSNGPNAYYFRTHFQWTNDTANLAFVVTNYLSDGAVYYINGAEVNRIRMPAGAVDYGTAAAGTNSPIGQADVFGIDGGTLLSGDNILEVETHQAPTSTADMVFGLSLTADSQFAILNLDSNLPASQGVYAGQSVTFTSDVIGSGPLYYQWFYNGTNAIAGANGPTYTIPLVLTNNAGTYSLQASNSFSSVTTATALLTVSNLPVAITTQPSNQVAMAGQPATFSIAVTGTPVIQYQWFFDGVAIDGATNSTYSIASTATTNSGTYEVTVSNPALTINSASASLTVLPNSIPPNIVAVSASVSNITVTFSEPVDPATASVVANYTVNAGVTVSSATPNAGNSAQVILDTASAMNFGTTYTLSINGVQDLYGNVAHVSGQFARDITIDGSFDDWTGLTPVYTSGGPSGNTDAADFAAIYMYDDTNFYYFRVTLWTDIDPSSGQFPDYVNMFFDTDNNAGDGYGPIGSDMLIQSGFSYQEKDGNFNDGFSINNLNWLCLPAAPGTNFEFEISKAATFGEDNTPVFTTNIINFLFEGMTPAFAVENIVPPSGGDLSYTNSTPVSVAALPLGKLAIFNLKTGQAALVWNPPGTLQVSSSASGGAWTSLTSATSPYILPLATTNQFFRLKE